MHARNPERGSAMLVTMTLITSMLAAGALLVALQLKASRSTDLARTGVSSLYCAEAGLTGARTAIMGNYDQWNAALASGTEPAFLSSAVFSHDIDGDGVDDFRITMRDNDDELPPATNEPGADSDLKVYLVSTCIKYPDQQKQVIELVEFKPAMNCYDTQEGGCNGRGNSNVAP